MNYDDNTTDWKKVSPPSFWATFEIFQAYTFIPISN